MQGRQLARGSALSSCFAKKEEPGQGTDPAALRPRLAMCSASTASTKAPSPNPGTAHIIQIFSASSSTTRTDPTRRGRWRRVGVWRELVLPHLEE